VNMGCGVTSYVMSGGPPNILAIVVPLRTMLTVVPFHHAAVFCAVVQREVFIIRRYAFESLTFSLRATSGSRNQADGFERTFK